MYVSCLQNFLSELIECIQNNRYVIFDFTLYAGTFNENTSERDPPEPNSKFDFRFLGELPREVPSEYINLTMDNCISEYDLEYNSIIPEVYITKWNPNKGDMMTYMFWGDNCGEQN